MMKSATWIVLILALWVGWPSAGCLCANGGFKFFCDAHRVDSRPPQATPATVEKHDCCQHRSSVERDMPTSEELSSKGCTPLVSTPVIVPVSVSKAVDSLDHSVAFITLPVAAIAVPSAQSSIVASAHHTGPPVDIVTELHRLLI